jgi:hypothetical protein
LPERRPIQLGKSRKRPLDIVGHAGRLASALSDRQRSDSGIRRCFGGSFSMA